MVTGSTVIVNCRVAMFLGTLLSVTWAVKVELPAAGGVPASLPAALSVIPGGRAPAATDHL